MCMHTHITVCHKAILNKYLCQSLYKRPPHNIYSSGKFVFACVYVHTQTLYMWALKRPKCKVFPELSICLPNFKPPCWVLFLLWVSFSLPLQI